VSVNYQAIERHGLAFVHRKSRRNLPFSGKINNCVWMLSDLRADSIWRNSFGGIGYLLFTLLIFAMAFDCLIQKIRGVISTGYWPQDFKG